MQQSIRDQVKSIQIYQINLNYSLKIHLKIKTKKKVNNAIRQDGNQIKIKTNQDFCLDKLFPKEKLFALTLKNKIFLQYLQKLKFHNHRLSIILQNNNINHSNRYFQKIYLKLTNVHLIILCQHYMQITKEYFYVGVLIHNLTSFLLNLTFSILFINFRERYIEWDIV